VNYLILLMIIFLQGCVPFRQGPASVEAEMKIYNEWLYAYKLNDFKIDSAVITRPPGIEQLLFSLTLPTEGGLNLKTHCVYYRVPYKEILGLLKIVEQKNENGCSSTSKSVAWLEILDIKDLAVKLENFKFNMSFKFKDQKTEWNYSQYRPDRIRKNHNSAFGPWLHQYAGHQDLDG